MKVYPILAHDKPLLGIVYNAAESHIDSFIDPPVSSASWLEKSPFGLIRAVGKPRNPHVGGGNPQDLWLKQA
jgi:hypothetical protein